RQLVSIEITEHRKIVDDIAYNPEFRIRQLAIGGGHDNHRVDQGTVMVEHAGSFRGSVGQSMSDQKQTGRVKHPPRRRTRRWLLSLAPAVRARRAHPRERRLEAAMARPDRA